MNNNLLRAPLIKSAVLLFVFMLIIYLTATSHEASVWSSIGTIFYAVFKAAQLGVGLILSLVLCLAILIGIFLGGVAMVSTDSASRMYNQLRQVLAEKIALLNLPLKKEEKAAGEIIEELRTSLNTDMTNFMESSVADVQKSLDEKLHSIQLRLEQIEADDSHTVLADRLQQYEDKLHAMEESVGSGTDAVNKLHEQLTDLSQQFKDLQADAGKGDPSEKIATLERSTDEVKSLFSRLAEEFKFLQDELNAVKTAGQQEAPEGSSEEEETETDSEHRLFTYIDDEKEQEKIGRVVTEGLQNELTYAQIMEQLAQQTNEATARALDEHPALTKDYIRHLKKSG